MKYYKLTDKNHETTNHTKWGEGITHKATGRGKDLCSEAVIHCYDHPLKAAFFNCIHASFDEPILWEGKAVRIVANDQTKIGCKQFTTERIIPLPQITTEQRVTIAILCAKEVYKDSGWNKWADSYLNNKDRSSRAAYAAADAARDAAYADDAAYAAYAARGAAAARAYAAAAAADADAADDAAYAAADAARDAAYAAFDAARDAGVDILTIILKVIKDVK